MRFNEAMQGKQEKSKDRKDQKPTPGKYTSKDLEKSKDRPFLGGR